MSQFSLVRPGGVRQRYEQGPFQIGALGLLLEHTDASLWCTGRYGALSQSGTDCDYTTDADGRKRWLFL